MGSHMEINENVRGQMGKSKWCQEEGNQRKESSGTECCYLRNKDTLILV